ncbi:MAG: ATP-binding protein [Burkholderiaceae bacterium]
MIPRHALATVQRLARWYPAVAITGPRQAGKTTLARLAFPKKPYANLEDPDQREFASSDGKGFLAQFPDGAILDEVQRVPELFSWLQSRLHGDRRRGVFVLTGSYQFGLRRGISQTLAGRVGHVHLLPLSAPELEQARLLPGGLETMLQTGFYPPVYDRRIPAAVWYADYVATYVERDLLALIRVRERSTFQRFLRMCAARTAQLLNLSALAADCGITHNTAKSWLSVLEASYVVTLLTPWHRNLGKRLIKTPKLYFLDAGLAAWLAGIRRTEDLALGPMRGALFETWVLSEFVKYACDHALPAQIHFWRDAHGNEVDLLVEGGTSASFAVECKAGRTVAGDWFAPLAKFCVQARCAGAGIVYGGHRDQPRRGIPVYGWRSLPALLGRCFETAAPARGA